MHIGMRMQHLVLLVEEGQAAHSLCPRAVCPNMRLCSAAGRHRFEERDLGRLGPPPLPSHPLR